jgi:hypothetical protein
VRCVQYSPSVKPELKLIEDVMRHGGFQPLMAQGALRLAQIPLRQFCSDKAPKVVWLDLRR